MDCVRSGSGFRFLSLLLIAGSFLVARPSWSQDDSKNEAGGDAATEAPAEAKTEPGGLWEWVMNKDSHVFESDEVLVTASRLRGEGLPRERMAANVSVISGEEIQQSRARTLNEYLQRELGVVTYDVNGNGRQVTLELRGFNEGGNTVVMIDGVVQNASDSGGISWEAIPVENIDRVEILRGPNSTVAGRGSSAGVINIMTKRGGGRPTITAGVDAGEHKYNKFWTATSGSYKQARWASHTVREQGATEQSDSQFRRTGTWQRLGLDLERGSIDITHTSENSFFQQPSSKSRPMISASRTDSRKDRPDYGEQDLQLLQFAWNWTLSDEWSFSATAYTRDQDSRGVNHFAGGGGGSDSRVSEESWGYAAQVQHEWENEWFNSILTFGGDYSRWEYETISRSTDNAGNWATSIFNPVFGFVSDQRALDQRVFGIFVNENVKLWDRLTLSAGVRHDESKLEFSNVYLPAQNSDRSFTKNSVKLGAVLDLPKNFQVYGSWSQGYRIPAVFELFAFGGFQFDDNALLDPEETESWEVGARWAFRDLFEVEASYYESETDEDIQFVATGLFSGQNQNAGNVHQNGTEIAARARLARNLVWWNKFTNSRAFFGKGTFPKGNQVPLVPEYTYSTGATFTFLTNWTWSADYTWVSDRIMNSDQAHDGPRWDGFGTLNSQLQFNWKNFQVWGAVTNLLDEHHETWAIWSAFSVPQQPFYVVGPERNFRFGFNYTYEF